MEPDTRLAHAGRDPEGNFGIVNPPVYRASTILYPTLAEFENRSRRKFDGFAYGLHGTPTTLALAEAVAELSGGFRTMVASSGLAAVTQTLTALLRQGDHLLIADTVYGPTREFCTSVLARFGVDVTFYDPLVGGEIAGLLRDRTRVVYLESPGSLTFEVQDVPAIAAAAHARSAVVVLDNTWATPLGFRAFEHEVDVEVLAGTKHLAGHSDLLLGLITTRTEPLFRTIREGTTTFGDCVAPDVCYEGLRGLRTLGVRLRHHAASTLEVARWLQARPEVARVLHPALPGDPGHALWTRDFVGASSLFAILLRTESERAVAAMVEGMRLFRIGASFGGFESLITPARPAAQRTARPWREPGFLLRLHVGLEAVSDLIADLDEGFARLHAALRAAPSSVSGETPGEGARGRSA
jgi:cystathionine beta-lyase